MDVRDEIVPRTTSSGAIAARPLRSVPFPVEDSIVSETDADVVSSLEGYLFVIMQIIRLRIKYAAKMLLHEVNIHSNHVQTLVDQFMHLRPREVIEKEIIDAIRNRQSRKVKFDDVINCNR